MKKVFGLLLCFGLFAGAYAQTYNGPESCEYDYTNGRWLVGNKNNGTVLARASNGVLSPFASGMTSGPYGIEILGNTLYCCYGGGKIRGFDLTSGSQVFDVNTGATFLNGITSDGDSILYVTDFTAKSIYAVNVNSQAYGIVIDSLGKSPNGIIYDGPNNRCIFVNWGSVAPISALNLADSTVSNLASTSLANCDGIARDGAGNYYVSAWGTQAIYKFNSTFTGGPTLITSGMSNPADIFYNVVQDTLGVPNSGSANNLVLIGFGGSTVGVEEENIVWSSIGPNPAGSEVVVWSEHTLTQVTLVDSQGRAVLRSTDLHAGPDHRYTIDLAQVSAGIYSLEVSDAAGKVAVHRLVIRR